MQSKSTTSKDLGEDEEASSTAFERALHKRVAFIGMKKGAIPKKGLTWALTKVLREVKALYEFFQLEDERCQKVSFNSISKIAKERKHFLLSCVLSLSNFEDDNEEGSNGEGDEDGDDDEEGSNGEGNEDCDDDEEDQKESNGDVDNDQEDQERSLGDVDDDQEDQERSLGDVDDDQEDQERSLGDVDDDQEDRDGSSVDDDGNEEDALDEYSEPLTPTKLPGRGKCSEPLTPINFPISGGEVPDEMKHGKNNFETSGWPALRHECYGESTPFMITEHVTHDVNDEGLTQKHMRKRKREQELCHPSKRQVQPVQAVSPSRFYRTSC